MLINTTKGEVDSSLLQKREGGHENKNERVTWVEYWDGGDPSCKHVQADVSEHHCVCGAEKVHRSVNMHLKKPMVFAEATAQKLPGG